MREKQTFEKSSSEEEESKRMVGCWRRAGLGNCVICMYAGSEILRQGHYVGPYSVRSRRLGR